jgi:hypothetical protein
VSLGSRAPLQQKKLKLLKKKVAKAKKKKTQKNNNSKTIAVMVLTRKGVGSSKNGRESESNV